MDKYTILLVDDEEEVIPVSYTHLLYNENRRMRGRIL